MKTEAIIRLRGVEFLNIIKYPNIDIYANKLTFITGKSGAGKSTLFRMLNRTQGITEGEITFNGKSITMMKGTEIRQSVLLVDQSPFLFDTSIRENFLRFYEMRKLNGISEQEMKEYQRLMEVDFPLDKPIHELSGGEKQRLFTAINLSFNPDVILLDEPTASLDPKTSRKVMSNIRKYATLHNITPIVICHDHDLVEEYAEERIDL